MSNVTRDDIEKVVHAAGGGFFDARLDAITDAVWELVRPDPAEWLASELEQASRDVITSAVGLMESTFGLQGLAVHVDGIVDEIDWRQVARNHIGGN